MFNFKLSWLKENLNDILIIFAVIFIYLLFRYFLTKVAEKFGLRKSLSKILNYTFIVLLIEIFRAKIVLTDFLNTVATFFETSFIILIFYHLIISVYINDFLKEYKGKSVKHIIVDIIKFIFIIIFVLSILRIVFNVNLITILTPSAILTAIVGLSMKDTIGNLISGLIIQIEKPFEVGDWIKVDDYIGQIVEINWRYTKLKTLDNIFLIIPNNNISSGNLINYNRPEKAIRLLIEIGVSYDTPPDKLKSVVKKVLNSSVYVDKDREISVFLKRYNDFSIDYDIAFWIKEYLYTREARDEVYSRLWYEFKLAGIEIPFPIRTIVYKDNENKDVMVEDEIFNSLKRLELFSSFNDDDLKMLITFSNIRYVAQNEIVVKRVRKGIQYLWL